MENNVNSHYVTLVSAVEKTKDLTKDFGVKSGENALFFMSKKA